MNRLAGWRPPRSARTRAVQPPAPRPAVARIVAGREIGATVQRLFADDALRDLPTLLLATTTTSGRLAATTFQLGRGRVQLVLARGRAPTWLNAARHSNVAPVQPGAGGWVRLELPDPGFQLDAVYMPLEITSASRLVVLPGRRLADGPIALWLNVVHPHTALRVRAAPERATLLAELLACVNAEFVVPIGVSSDSRPTAVARVQDALSAQLIWLAARRFEADADAPETVSPWEDQLVQAAVQLGIGPDSGRQLIIELDGADRLVQPLGASLVELLDCRVVRFEEEQERE